MKWFLKCIRNYVNFSGRARRSEYWYFTLFAILLMIVAMALDMVCFGQPYRLFYLLVAVFLFLPQLAVSVRRLHDIGRSGKIFIWYYVLSLVWTISLVLAGLSTMAGGETASVWFLVLLFGGCLVFLAWSILLLVWLCTAGTPGDNRYGADPRRGDETPADVCGASRGSASDPRPGGGE